MNFAEAERVSGRLCLTWHGPFTFSGPDCVFENCDAAENPGVYLWTIKYADGYLVNYVGQASKQTIQTRLAQGVEYILSGKDSWADLDRFARGIRVVEPRIPIQQFLRNYEDRSREVIQLLRLYHVFIAPYTGDVCTTKQIESLLIDRLRQGESTVATFLANKQIGKPPPQDVRVEFRMPSQARLIGLESLVASDSACA
jgi:hypothetical protein